jgi:CubicO group peptidase (beta-lactamase class C family)
MSVGGFSRARLGRMHEVMAGHVERGTVPGIVTLVSRRGETRVDVIGTKDIATGDPVQRDTIFRIASMTKPILAAATMVLVEECTLRLDDPVDPWLPELANRRVLKHLAGALDDTVPAKRPINLRDLLTLRPGFGFIAETSADLPIQKAMDEAGLAPGPDPPAHAPAEWMKRLGRLPLAYQPGEKWMYHTAFDVLAVLLARASGQPLETVLRERIFEPLGMKDTGFSVPAAKLDRLTTCYRTDPASGGLEVHDEAASGAWSRPPVFPSELASTADDYLAFGQMMLGLGKLGGERILSRPSVEAMTTDQLTAEQRAGGEMILGSARGWGFGVSVVTRHDGVSTVPGRFGWDGGFGTSWASDPKEDMVAILMTQRIWDSPSGPAVYHDFWTSVYQAIDD